MAIYFSTKFLEDAVRLQDPRVRLFLKTKPVSEYAKNDWSHLRLNKVKMAWHKKLALKFKWFKEDLKYTLFGS
jgi:hypothetical protein